MKKINSQFFSFFYTIVFACYTFNLFIEIPSVGIMSSLLMGVLLLTLLLRKEIIKDKIDYLVLIFALVQVLSVLWFPKDRYPYTVYIKDFVYTILPITFFYLKNNPITNFFKYANYAIFYSLVIGIILFILAPDFYSQYLYNHAFTRSLLSTREAMQSFYGVTSVGFFSVLGVSYSIHEIFIKKSSSLRFNVTYFFVCAFSLVLSGRRSAILTAILVVLFYLTILLLNNKKSLILKLILGGAVGIIVFGCLFPNQFMYLLERIASMPYAIGERSANWGDNLSSVNNLLVGNGLGSASHHVLAYGGIGVFDSQYLKIYVESGMLGITLFIAILSFSLKKAYFNKNYLSVCLLCVFIIQAIGSNIFSFQQLSPLIWFVIGQSHLQEVN